MALNLDLITNGATIGDMVGIINKNFNAIIEFGGGPQGPINNKSLPGLPGLGGKEGLGGLDGDDGNITLMTAEDDNWNVLYGPAITVGTAPYPDASKAIDAGYELEDKWIDNINGIYYSIDGTVGSEIFVSYPISNASVSDFWIVNPTAGNRTTGTRYSAHTGTIVMTTLPDATNPPDDSAPTTDALYNQLFLSNGNNYGFNRDDFKLSTDAKPNVANVSTTPTIFNIQQKEYAPAFYIGDFNTNNSGSAPMFAYMMYTDNSGSDNQVLAISNSKGVIYNDVLSFGTTNEFFSVAKQTADVNRITMINNDGDAIYNDISHWFSISRLIDETPAGNITGFDDMGGIKLINSATDTLSIEFYVNSDTTDVTPFAYDKVMSMESDKKIRINSFNNADATLTVLNNETDISPAAASNSIAIQTKGFGDSTNTTGTSLRLGYGQKVGNTNFTGDSWIYSIGYADTLTPGSARWQSHIILQPDDATINTNTGISNVGIGFIEPAARLSVDGSIAVGINKVPMGNSLLSGENINIGENSEFSAQADASLRSLGGIMMGYEIDGSPAGANASLSVGIGFNLYKDISDNYILHDTTSNSTFGADIRVARPITGGSDNIGLNLITKRRNVSSGIIQSGSFFISAYNSRMGYIGLNNTDPTYAMDIKNINPTIDGGIRINTTDNLTDYSAEGIFIGLSASDGNVQAEGYNLLIKNLSPQLMSDPAGGEPDAWKIKPRNIILETSYGEYTGNKQYGSVIVKNDLAGNSIIHADFLTKAQLQVLYKRGNNSGLLINIDDGNLGGDHLFLKNGNWSGTGSDTQVFFSSGGVSKADGTFVVYGDGSVIALSVTETSDERFKTNIAPLSTQDSLNQIMKLNPVSFDWKENPTDKKNLGLIAQDIDNIIPEVVSHKNPDKLAIEYTSLIPVLISAIQELKKIINLKWR